MRSIATAILLGVVSATASAGGIVNVTFVDPERFTDAGDRSYQYSPNVLKQLEEQFRSLGERVLADGQLLTIDVTDVDLAGELRPAPRRGGDWIRVVRGRADWPRIALRYTLEANGQLVKRGEETLADLDYTHNIPIYSTYQPLSWERLMLEAWFKARFSPASEPN
ncbi:MAG TPA: DUF3016 domain-containing protein [Burkholderiaceae bacterium]|nr:DUF3016 domain-containing protein [Burkholderiaceae bacterium]